MKILFLLLMLAAAQAFGAMTLIKREMFVGTGQLTTNAPDQFDVVSGTLNCRYGGPLTTGSNGYSMDNMRATANNYGQFTLPNTNTNYLLGCWVFVKPPIYPNGVSHSMISFGITGDNIFSWSVMDGMLKAERINATNQVVQINNSQWIWLGVAIKNNGGPTSTGWDVKFYKMPLGGVLTNCVSMFVDSGWTQRQSLNRALVWSSGNGVNQTWNGRIGAVSLYSIADFTDVAYPSDLIPPTTPIAWYVNPATGNDTNTGAYPNQAWQTAQKIDSESANCGLFPATNYVSGDTLLIDTSAGALDLTQTNLTFATRGLNVMATNAPYWTNLMAVTLTNSSFTLAGSNTYAYNTGSNQQNIVVWEDNKWMNHPQGATYLVVSNSLATNAGSFWTDGTNAYIHPFSDSNPLSDGKAYTRSWFGSGIDLGASDMNFRDCYAGKTALIQATNNVDGIGGYVLSTSTGFGGNSVIAHCYFYYGSKHTIGLVGGWANANVIVQDVQAEQSGLPITSASPWVLFMDGLPGESNNVYSFIRCRTDEPSGQIGSTSGTTGVQGIFLMHNSSGSGIQFKSVTFDSCQMNGQVGYGICSNAIVTNCVFGSLTTGATISNIVMNSKFISGGVDLFYNSAINTVVQNCIYIETYLLTFGLWSEHLQGNNVIFQNNTFDFSGVYSPYAGANYGQFVRSGPLTNFIFRNNIVILNSFGGTNQFSAFQNFNGGDTCSVSNNLYVLGSSNWLAANYTNGTSGTNLTFAQWQALGFDANSAVVDNPHLTSSYIPETGSAAIGKGLNLSNFSTTDYAGNPRPATGNWTIGAYQVASSTGGAGIITIFFLPAATGAGGTLKLAWLADYLGWILQSQTNSLNTGLSTNWVDVPGSSAITQTNITIDSAKPLMFFRLRSP